MVYIIQAGDIVRVKVDFPSGNDNLHVGDIGTALQGYGGSYDYLGVLFPGLTNGHKGNSRTGLPSDSKECWEIQLHDLEFVRRKVSKINRDGNLV